jgi:hypothetical protein
MLYQVHLQDSDSTNYNSIDCKGYRFSFYISDMQYGQEGQILVVFFNLWLAISNNINSDRKLIEYCSIVLMFVCSFVMTLTRTLPWTALLVHRQLYGEESFLSCSAVLKLCLFPRYDSGKRQAVDSVFKANVASGWFSGESFH